MSNQQARIALRNTLIRLYNDRADAKRAAEDAGLNVFQISFEGSATNVWHNILAEAEKQGKAAVQALIEVASGQYPNDEGLQQAVTAYWGGSTVPSQARAPENPSVPVARQETNMPTSPWSQLRNTRALPLSPTDQTHLIDVFYRIPAWVNGSENDRRGFLLAAGLPDQFVYGLHVTGAPKIAATLTINATQKLSHLIVKPTHLGLGALIEYLLDEVVTVEDKRFLAYLVDRYQLITTLDYLEELRLRYTLLQELPKNQSVDLGWQTNQPSFSWRGPTDPRQLEAIWRKRASFLDTVFLEQGSRAAQAVCRIEFGQHDPQGTGFLVAPNLVLTNHHVLPTDEVALQAQARFGYRMGADGKKQDGESYQIQRVLKRSPADALDFALVELAAAPTIDKLTLKANQLQTDTSAFIIQHPIGEPQKVVLQDNWIVYVAPDHQRVQYLTNTQHGSSGSPVFNDKWEVIALHHSSAPFPNAPVTVEGNEGIPMLALLPELQSFLA